MDVRRVDLAKGAIRTSLEFTTDLNISSVRVFDQIRDLEIPITLHPHVHRCGADSMRAYLAVGPGSIPGRAKFPG